MNHKAKKHFGQNFLHDKNLIHKIISSFAPKATDCILEIGPGLGALTEPLLDKITNLSLVEIDKTLAEKLVNKYKDQINLYNTDILKFDFNQVLESANMASRPSESTEPGSEQEDPSSSAGMTVDVSINSIKKLRIIGNLPYNISTPILFHLFDYIDIMQDMMFMLQLEVVDRIIAEPNTKQYGRLSVMTQYFCETDKLFTIPPQAFTPQPKVQSAIVYLQPKSQEELAKVNNYKLFDSIVLAAFNQRRKTISNSLKDYISSEQLLNLNLDPKARAENLSLNDYIAITKASRSC